MSVSKFNNQKKNSFFIIFLFLILILALILTGLFFWVRSTPQYAMSQMLQAVKDRNYDKFEEYLDYQEIFTREVNKNMQNSEETQEQELLDEATMNQLIQAFIPATIQAVKEEVKKNIENGEVAKAIGSEFEEFDSRFLLPGIFSGLKWQKVGENYKVEIPYNNENSYLIWGKKDNKWKIVEIENFDRLMDSDSDLSKEESEVKVNFDEVANSQDFEIQILSIKKGQQAQEMEGFDDFVRYASDTESLLNKNWLGVEILVKNNKNETRIIDGTSTDIYLTDSENKVLPFNKDLHYGNDFTSPAVAKDFVTSTLFFEISEDKNGLFLNLPVRNSGFSSGTKVVFQLPDSLDFEAEKKLPILNFEAKKTTQTVEFNTMKITLDSYNLDAQTQDDFVKSGLRAGEKFVSLDLTVENVSNSTVYPVSNLFLKDEKGRTYKTTSMFWDGNDTVIQSLDKSQKGSGQVAFTVPKSVEKLYLYTSNNNLNSSQVDIFILN